MNATDHDLDKIRGRWTAERDRLGLSDPSGESFALGGLGSLCRDLDVRLAILPRDPQAQIVDFDEDVVGWLQAQRHHEYRDVTDYGQTRTTSSAVVIHDRSEQFQWEWFVAIQRHGGIDAAHSSMSRVNQEERFFFLRHIVSFSWLCLDLQKEASEKWAIQGAFEMTLGLRETMRARLGDFAEGWEPAFGVYRDSKRCLEPNVLLRWEFDNDFEPKELAIDVGARIENAFCSIDRRHLARRGNFQGKFDPR